MKILFLKNNICFLFAPYFHTSLKKISEIRKSSRLEQFLTLLGPIVNPVNLSYQLLGVSNEKNLNYTCKMYERVRY